VPGLEQIFNHRFEPPIRSIPTKAAARPAVEAAPHPPRQFMPGAELHRLRARQIQQQFGEPRRLADNNVRPLS